MTTVFTRLFASEKSTAPLISRMQRAGIPTHAIRVLSGSDEGIADKLKNAGVKAKTVAAYGEKLTDDTVVLLVATTYKPLGVARIVRDMLDRAETVDVGNCAEENRIATRPDAAPSILKGHPRFATILSEVTDRGPITRELGFRMLARKKTKRSAISGGRFMSRMFWPMPLIKKNRTANSAISGGRQMSKAFWPMPLISKKPRRPSVVKGGDNPMSRVMGWRTISK
jgi:hypothetical protein